MTPKLIIGVTSYNIENFIDRCLASIKSQTHTDFKCFITDDLSTDTTVDRINSFIQGDDRFVLIQNETKRYQCGNYDLICRETEGINEDDIFIEVDGDDHLSDDGVFARIYDYYSKSDLWIANGSFMFETVKEGSTRLITDMSKLRTEPFTASHIRTWKIFLWRAMKIEDLKDQNGNYWVAGGDLIFMYDMLEMAGLDHYTHMTEVNYIYNDLNPIGDGITNGQYQTDMCEFAKNKTPRELYVR